MKAVNTPSYPLNSGNLLNIRRNTDFRSYIQLNVCANVQKSTNC
jgi:hypothetical protein